MRSSLNEEKRPQLVFWDFQFPRKPDSTYCAAGATGAAGACGA